MILAKDFSEILNVLAGNNELRAEVSQLMGSKPIHGKCTEESARLAIFRKTIIGLASGRLSSLEAAYEEVEEKLPPSTSIHGGNNRVFPHDWAERHVRTQLSRFYNQVVMERMMKNGKSECFVHHSSLEDPSTPCSRLLAGKKHEVKELYDRLIKNYENGNWDNNVKIPNHPHCTHTVFPVNE